MQGKVRRWRRPGDEIANEPEVDVPKREPMKLNFVGIFEPRLVNVEDFPEDVRQDVWEFYMFRALDSDVRRWCAERGLREGGLRKDSVERLTRHMNDH